MAEFRTPGPYNPMDREYHERMELEPVKGDANVEEPIFPIGQLGATVPETDQSGRFKTFLQHAQANIRAGAGNLQLVMTVPHTSPIGGRFKAYGKEVREALREIAKANEVKMEGVELPTSSMTNMSGYDMQRNRFSDEVRKDHLDEVRDAIKFVAEAMGGGGVDIVSWEFDRPINDATWNREDPKAKKSLFKQPGEMEIVQVVDTKTGGIAALRKGEAQHLPYFKPVEGEEKEWAKSLEWDGKRWVIKEIKEIVEGIPVVKEWQWNDFKKAAELINEKAKTHNATVKTEAEKWPEIKPETLLIQMQLEAQRRTAYGYAGHYGSQAKQVQDGVNMLTQQITDLEKDPAGNAAAIEKKKKDLEKANVDVEHLRSLAQGQIQQVKEIEERQKRFTAVSDYAVAKAVASYAEAGVWALEETHNKAPYEKQPIHVGPEIGWPQYYGSHPDEFVNTIRNARKEMVNLLTKPKRMNWEGKFVDENGQPVADEKSAAENPHFKKGVSVQQAEEEARKHIKGVFDTGHLGMWLRNFRPDLPWDKRVDEFNKWFTGQVEKIAEINKKEQIIGAIQAVDSATGAHAHLPPGQGILPVFEAVKILKQKGNFNGFIVSEGHEEEKFGEGRILLKTWEKFGAHINDRPGYHPAGVAPIRWSAIQQSYFGKTYSPMFMFGSYAPSNEFKLWSEIPLE